jgi:glucose/arabinose dehydrogenase
MRSQTIPDGLEIIAQNLDIPWSIEFSPKGILYYTERTGSLKKLVKNEKITLIELNVIAKKQDESGLLGMTFSPNYSKNKHIYLYYTYTENGKTWNKVSRFIEHNDILKDEATIIDKIPGARVHNGGRIKFGPDNHLYITTGEIWERKKAQNLNDLGGKILRLTENGNIPKDNPWPNSPIYSYGNRNPQGLAWHPKTKSLFSSEHGPSGEQLGWRANDEINIITPGGNYGWPKVIGSPKNPKFIDPLIGTGADTWAPSGICFYTGDKIPSWKNSLLVANLRGNHLKAVHLKSPDYTSVELVETYYHRTLGRLRDLTVGPDGYLYICTSNTDGRGNPVQGDDVIVKVVESPRASVDNIIT